MPARPAPRACRSNTASASHPFRNAFLRRPTLPRRVICSAAAQPEPGSPSADAALSASSAGTAHAPGHAPPAPLQQLLPHIAAALTHLRAHASAWGASALRPSAEGDAHASPSPPILAHVLGLNHTEGPATPPSPTVNRTAPPAWPAPHGTPSLPPQPPAQRRHTPPPRLPWPAERSLPLAASSAAGSADAGAAPGPGPGPGSAASLPLTVAPPTVTNTATNGSLVARLLGMALLLQSAASLPQRVAASARSRLARAGRAVDGLRHGIPPVDQLPYMARWTAADAAVRTEEELALALANAASAAASAAAAALPAAASAAAAPRRALLAHQRRRLAAAAAPLLAQLRDLQTGCTTHVLLGFVLYSAVQPAVRRRLLVRMEVVARRAAQLAVLQAEHEAWLAHVEQEQGSGGGGLGHVPSRKDLRKIHPLQQADAGSASASPSSSSFTGPSPNGGSSGATEAVVAAAGPALSARWYGSVLVAELAACGRQLRVGATHGSVRGPDDAWVGGRVGRFDLRDLYRLTRVVQAAVDDLQDA